MWLTFGIGNIVYAGCVWACWLECGGDRARFFSQLIILTLMFVGGVVTGIVANRPSNPRLRIVPRKTNPWKTQGDAEALETITD